MRIVLFALLATAGLGSVSEAQTAFGLRLSPTVNFGRLTVNNRADDAIDNRTGFEAVLHGTYYATDNFGIGAGLGMSFRNLGGFAYYRHNTNGDPTSVLESQVINTQFLTIPVHLQLISSEIGTGWFLKGRTGGSLDILTGGRYRGTETIKTTSGLQPLGFTALVGLGAEWRVMESGYLEFGISYHHGLFDMLKRNYEVDVIDAGNPSNIYTETPFRNRTLKVSYLAFDIGFLFN